MSEFFFSGSSIVKLDEKNRFVLPQSMRFGLIENGKLEFTIALGLGGSLTIYRQSSIQKIVEKFRKKQHQARFQKFFTLFFSTLFVTTCDKIGRITLPGLLKDAVKIKKEIVVAGVLDKIELWPKESYENHLQSVLSNQDTKDDLQKIAEDAFALLSEEEEEKGNHSFEGMQKISQEHIPVGQFQKQ